ncbi:MAG TPA: ribosome small subunit-dependent GTPase A [Bacteroidales bacterium]|nr:ribosome small subunit-dependent GTPase A [Bacteroidales bacterium]
MTTLKGIVIKSTGSWHTVRSSEAKEYLCKLKGQYRIRGLKATNPLTVGDHVEFYLSGAEEVGIIDKILPRKNYIIRKSKKLSKQVHIIAANIDMAYLVVTPVQPRTSTGFIDRFLITAEAYHIPATLIFNKIDLYDSGLWQQHQDLVRIYTGAGYPCIEVSALRGDNIDVLRDKLKDTINLFSGHSGVGKSALINAVDPTKNLKTGAISEMFLKGKHTTTFTEMLCLQSGGYIIDTPGIKEFGLIDFKREDLTHYFPEFFKLLAGCKYYNCTHINEPGCAVKKALEEGTVSQSRYKNYLSIFYGEDIDINEWE